VAVGTKIVAVNLGGAVIPTALSLYLMVHDSLGWQSLVAVSIVTLATHLVARVVPVLGSWCPRWYPAYSRPHRVGSPRRGPSRARVRRGTLGTLIGGDVPNLRRLRELDAAILSIGGAGTFDGIFVTGILAVLLAMI
jgi:uncharacterized membrane protein